MSQRTRWMSTTALLAATLLVGCGGGSQSPSTSTGGGTASTQPTPSATTSASPSTSASASAAPGATLEGTYIALGDSLAAGFQPSVGDVAETAYPALVSTRLGGLSLTNLACSGENTRTTVSGGKCSYPEGSQLAAAEAAITAAGDDLALVTIDIGGNDLLFCARGAKVDTACTTGGTKTLDANLPTIFARLRAAAGKDVPILAIGYYNPWLAAGLRGSDAETVKAQKVVDDLNARIRKHAIDAGLSYVSLDEAFSADDTSQTEVEGRAMPANVAAICQYTYACTFGDVHLTDEGSAVVAGAVAAAARAAGGN